jgi:hypothetical protein
MSNSKLVILNLLTGERIRNTDEREPVTPSQLLAETLPFIMPNAPDGFAALLECAGEPRLRRQGAINYPSVEHPTQPQRGHYCTIVVAFPGCHYAAHASVLEPNPQNQKEEEDYFVNAYTPEANNAALDALYAVNLTGPLTRKEEEHAERTRAKYIASITEE